MHMLRQTKLILYVLAVASLMPRLALAQLGGLPLPPVPVPPENPLTEEKRILGKILFWDEQLSSDNTVACGTCHKPGQGGADQRIGIYPGFDGVSPSQDDIQGSPGVVLVDAQHQPLNDPIFGFAVQVTDRASPSFFTGQYAREIFWDGRAASRFVDPQSGETIIPQGGALESQAMEPILSSVEMAHLGRTWNDVIAKLAAATPMALATDLPPDMVSVLLGGTQYPALFAAAFGDDQITAARIGMAIASYERTLVANQTPWDAFNSGDQNALTQNQRNGLDSFVDGGCVECHVRPFFSDHSFRNIGLRPVYEDLGRQAVTGNTEEAGRMKVPSLRNVGLKPTFMRTGQFTSLPQVLDFYLEANGQQHFEGNKDPAIDDLNIPPQLIGPLLDFLQNGLTDPRVAGESFPFDRPTLASEMAVTGTEDRRLPPISQNIRDLDIHPNPFNPRTLVSFELTHAADLSLQVCDLAGRLVRTLEAGRSYSAGRHQVDWNGTDAAGRSVASGVYILRVDDGQSQAMKRMTLLK